MMSEGITIRKIRESGVFNNIDLVFAGQTVSCLPEGNGGTRPEILFLASALTSCLMQQGHSCCDLSAVGGTVFGRDEEKAGIILPSYEEFREALIRASDSGAAVFVPDHKVKNQPLVIDPHGRLYLNRYYRYETAIAEELRRRSRLTRNNDENWDALAELPPGKLSGLSSRFTGKTELDHQQAAIFLAHARNFSIITGGPGTGKTTVLTALLAWEIEDDPEIRIELCAPTGKAQARMKESIADELNNGMLCCSAITKEKLVRLHCQTVDSLLHPILHTPNYQRDRNDPIPADLVVLDEVSMSSLSQLAHLFSALKPETRLILIGDKDQLSPVEAGAVLGDLIASGTINVMPEALSAQFRKQTGWEFPPVSDHLPLSGCIAELKINHRADKAPSICEISGRMRELDAAPVDHTGLGKMIMDSDRADFSFRDFSTSRMKLADAVREFLVPAEKMVRDAKEGSRAGLKNAFEQLKSFRILCAVRQGAYGVENINRLARKFLNIRSRYSVGMPLIVLKNTPSLNLFNGDIGLVWQEKEKDDGTKVANPETVVAFPCIRPDGISGFRTVRLSEMPPHETVYAMTVHKSQGSGFGQVMIVLPPRDVPILTRELLYTAITRAIKRVLLCCEKNILMKSLQNKTKRYSGLPDRLKENMGNE